MLALFRNNQTTSAFLLLAYIILTRVLALLGYVHPESKEIAPGGIIYQSLFGWVSPYSLLSIWIALFLVFIQALTVNFLADHFRLLRERTWLPGVFYALVTAFLPEFLYLSAPLVAVTAIPISIFYIFKSYKIIEVRNWVLDISFWLTVGSLFYPPAFILHLAGFIGLLLVRSFKFKERVVYFVGIMIPLFLAWLWYYWSDRGMVFWRSQLADLSTWYHFRPHWTERTIAEIVLVALLAILVVLSYGTYTNRKLIQIRNYVNVLYAFVIVAGFSILLQGNFYNTHLLLFMPSTGIFLAMNISEMRRESFAEILHIALLAAVFSMQTF
jgi:hypothetical protein